MSFPYGPLGSASELLVDRDDAALAPSHKSTRSMETSKKARDFIVLSEFSEQVGPVPVLVVPEKGAGSFNTSSFSVRIMSSDVQRSSERGSFSFTEDTQVVLSERADGLYAYVHYFRLHDIHARGYVRQYAISYITSSMKKIMDNFSDLLEKFSEVARMLRCGNHKVFGKDVEHRLADLEHTNMLLSNEGWNDKHLESSTLYEGFDFGRENVPERDPAVVENGIMEMKTIMEALKKEAHREINQRTQIYLESKRKSFQKLLSLYTPSAGSRDAASFLAQTSQEQPSLTGSPQSDLSISSEASHYQPQRVMAHYVHKFDRRLRNLHELSSKAYLVAMEKIDFVYKHFSRSESALAMEKEERQFLNPRSSVLTLGRVPVMNVLHNVMTSQSHLHETKPYILCSKEMDPKVQVLPPASGIEQSLDQCGPVFDKTFVEDANALNRCPLYLNPAARRLTDSFLSFSDSVLTPVQCSYVDFELEKSKREGNQSLPMIRGSGEGDEEGGGGGERGTVTRNSRSPQDPALAVGGALQVVSSGEFQETGSGDFHTPQEYRTPEKGNSPRVSTVSNGSGSLKEAESQVNGRTRSSQSPVPSSLMINSYPSTTTTSTKTSETPGEELDSHTPDFTTPMYQSALFSHQDSTDGSEMVREMKESANFRGYGTSSPRDEEVMSVGCGQLERPVRLNGESSVDTGAARLEEDVKEHCETPSQKSLQFDKTFSDQYYTPTKLYIRPPLQTMASVTSAPPPEVFSPTSLLMSPEKVTRWPHTVSLNSSSPLPFLCSVDQVEGEYKFKPGRGFLQFCKDHMSTRDLLYCLLHGRTLVIIGDPSQENMIRRLVRVLWLFVPGHSSSHQVIPWQESPLVSDDISRVKLIGLCQAKSSKQPVLPPHIKKYVSYWDCSTTKVCTPPYEGELLKPILSRTKDKKNEMTFLTHIHSVLSDIAMQAYVYYHGYCINNPRCFSPDTEVAPVRRHKVKEEPRKTRKQFLQHLGLKNNDTDIIEYLVSVIQNQQLDEQFTESRLSSQNGMVSVKISTKMCRESFCKPKTPY